MGKHKKGKSPLSALIPADLAQGVAQWLRRNPDYTRTDFAARALTEKLRKYGIGIPADADMDAVVERRSQRSVKSSQKRGLNRGSKRLLVTAWMDSRILEALDNWRKRVRPPMTRTTFFIEAIAEFLCEAELISDDVARKHGAYAEYRHANEQFKQLIRSSQQLTPKHISEQIAQVKQLLSRVISEINAIDEALQHSPPTPPEGGGGTKP